MSPYHRDPGPTTTSTDLQGGLIPQGRRLITDLQEESHGGEKSTPGRRHVHHGRLAVHKPSLIKQGPRYAWKNAVKMDLVWKVFQWTRADGERGFPTGNVVAERGDGGNSTGRSFTSPMLLPRSGDLYVDYKPFSSSMTVKNG